MSEAQPRNHVQGRDAEQAKERKRRTESGQQQMPGMSGETVPFVSLVGGSAMALPEERHAVLLGDPRLGHRANAVQRAHLVSAIQRGYGNRHLQRVIQRTRSDTHEPGPSVIQRTPLRIGGAEVGVYEFLLQTRDRFPRFRGVETGQILANNLQFGARNYTLRPTPELEEGETVSLRLAEGVFYLSPASGGGIRALGGGTYEISGVNEQGGLEPTGLQVSTHGLPVISEGILVYSARVQYIAETRVSARPPRDTEALARQLAEIVSGAGRLTAPATVARQVMSVIERANPNRDEMMDILQRLETAGQIAHFLELVRIESFRRFLRDRGVSWQYIFMNWEASINDCGQIFAGFLIGAGESVVDAVRLIGTLVGAVFSEELANDARQFFRAIERFFEHPITNTVRAARGGYQRFVNCLWDLELFEAGRILGNVAILVLTLPEAVRAVPSLARSVMRLSVRAIQETLGVSRAVLRRYARSPTARMVTPEGHVLMQSGDDIVVIGREGQSARISREAVLREGGEGAALAERPTEPGPGFGERPTEPGPGFGERPTQPAVEPTGGAPGILREFRTEAAARQIRDEVVARGRGGWDAALSEESLRAHWHEAGGTGEPPLAFIDRNGHLVFDARRLGLAPEELLAEGTRARLARRPPSPPAEARALPTIRAEILNAEFAQDMVACWRQAGNPVLFRNSAQIRRLWQAAGMRDEPPVGWVNAQGGLIVNRDLVPEG